MTWKYDPRKRHPHPNEEWPGQRSGTRLRGVVAFDNEPTSNETFGFFSRMLEAATPMLNSWIFVAKPQANCA